MVCNSWQKVTERENVKMSPQEEAQRAALEISVYLCNPLTPLKLLLSSQDASGGSSSL